MRVCFQYADEQYLYVTPLDEVSEKPYLVRYNIPQINEEFAETCKLLWRHAQVNLLDVAVDEAGILTPSFIVLEPDYLLDISSLAECFRDYGHHPANYFLSRLQPIENARPLLLGNIANLFLDEWIHAKSEDIDYRTCMQKAFRRYPIELAACSDLRDKEKERQFFEDCKLHFDHIRETVNDTFHAAGYELDKTDAVLEPSYICEALGLQGRLDYMQRDMSSFIEMKSGKADEYAIRGKVEPKENNKVQMLLYQAVLQYSMGMDHRKVKAYLLYTRYPLLYPSRPSWAMVRRVIDLRNRIVADEYGVQLRNSLEYTAQKLEEINASTLNERGLKGRFWETYLRPSIDNFQSKLKALSPLEKNYFYAVYNFITKELYTSKSGDVDYEGRTGAASLWLSTLAEKCEAGEIIYDLKIKENHAADTRKEVISDFYSIMGDIYHTKKQMAEAYAAYDSSLVYNPSNIGALNNYAYYLSVERRDLDKAEEMSYKTVKAEPNNSTYLDTYAWILFEKGNYAEARIYIDNAMKNDGEKSDVIVEHCGDIYFMTGDVEGALKYWKKALEMGSESKTLKQKIEKKKYIAE